MISPTLENYIESCIQDFDNIPADRKNILQSIAAFARECGEKSELANFTLICTHNSRRSHLSQVWTQVAARYYGLPHVFGYSGGTEATALFPSAAKALEGAGLELKKLSNETNAVYSIKYAKDEPAIIGFSKKYDDSFNPQSSYAAVMTCNHADQNCPVISGAATRISLPYDDPKAFDNTPEQAAKYAERCKHIATELLYAFSLLKK